MESAFYMQLANALLPPLGAPPACCLAALQPPTAVLLCHQPPLPLRRQAAA